MPRPWVIARGTASALNCRMSNRRVLAACVIALTSMKCMSSSTRSDETLPLRIA